MRSQIVFATGIPKSRDPGIFCHISRFPGIKVRETGKIPGFPGIVRNFHVPKSRDLDFRDICKH